MTVRWQVEIDAWCRRVLGKHWPGVTRYTDIKAIDWTEVEHVDLVCGGFPCQPWSMAGRQRGVDDERNLWPDTLRCLRNMGPRFALLENVPGLLTHEYFGEIIGDLAEVGYDAEWQVIPASSVGANHTRNRLYLLAYPCGARLEGIYQAGRREHLQSTAGALWSHWETEPEMDRVAYGLPRQVDRLRGLGNAVVPQVAEWVGRRIVEGMVG
jgi:DNA (cytosine-5)-methyltransferase 1